MPRTAPKTKNSLPPKVSAPRLRESSRESGIRCYNLGETGCMWKCRGNNTSYRVPRGSTQCPMAPSLHLLPPPLLHTSGNSAPSPGGSQGSEADIFTSHSMTSDKPRHLAKPQCDLSSPLQATGAPGEKRRYLYIPLIDSLTSSHSPLRDQA